MTKEEKDKKLLLLDLCARSPYGVKVQYNNEIYNIDYISPSYGEVKLDISDNYTVGISEVKPYLRPMSSMTEEEIVEINSMGFAYWTTMINNDLRARGPMSLLDAIITHHEMVKLIDWLNANHFDYRGLIEKGLAIEAPNDMYEI